MAYHQTIQLTPRQLRTMYEYLRSTAPFAHFGLPDGVVVTFETRTRRKDTGGMFHPPGPRSQARIVVVSKVCATYREALAIMAHEMVHFVRWQSDGDMSHGAGFRNLADLVCEIHGIPRRDF